MRHRKSKMRSRALFVAAIALVIFAYSVQAPFVHAWSGPTHQFIVNEAKDVFSDNSFFFIHYSTIYDYSTKPDQWKGSDPYEQYRHWYHIDEPDGENEYYRGGLPNNWSLLYKGVLPWAVEDNFAMLVQSLESEDWEHAAQLMGAIGHYTGDAAMPLHATSDHTPGGNHVDYEYEVNNHLYEISIPDYVPQELDNIFDAAKATLEGSFDFTDEDPEGGVNLSDFLEQDILWNDTIRDITENRLRASVQFTANLWYTAMIHAELTIQAPTLLGPENGATTSDDTPTFEWSSTVAGYQLEYATDNTFTTNVTIVKDLTTTSYTPASPLDSGAWYWRVRSGDNTTNVGLWSDTWLFTINMADFELEDIYTITLDFDDYLSEGENLVAKFYDYGWNYQDETVVCSENIPGHVTLLENISRPGRDAIEGLELVVIDNEDNVVLEIASFVVRKIHLETRFLEIPFEWSQADAAGKLELENEFMEIPFQWSGAPS